MQRHHLGAVAEGLVGVGVHLQEQPPRHGRPGQGGHELPLAAGAAAQPAGMLHRMEQGQRCLHLKGIKPFGGRRNGTDLLLQTAAQGGAGA